MMMLTAGETRAVRSILKAIRDQLLEAAVKIEGVASELAGSNMIVAGLARHNRDVETVEELALAQGRAEGALGAYIKIADAVESLDRGISELQAGGRPRLLD